MNGLADQEDLRLRFDVLTKTKQSELHRYWTTRDRAANVRLYRLAAEILAAVDAGVYPPRVGWHGLPGARPVLGVGVMDTTRRPAGGPSIHVDGRPIDGTPVSPYGGYPGAGAQEAR